jgi:hypothetical protein
MYQDLISDERDMLNQNDKGLAGKLVSPLSF